MEVSSTYKIVFFLLSVLIITTIIGEFARLEITKEGFGMGDFGGLIKMFIKLVLCSGQFFIMIFKLILWLIQCSVQWFPFFLIWLTQYIVCAFQKLLNIPNCSLWYGMEIAGKMFYLPFRITFAVLDMIFGFLAIDFSIQYMVNRVWWFIDDIDHAMYDGGSGFHIVHYPDDVIKRCYSCDIGNYPKMPKFPMGAVTAFSRCVG
jgi:hypothetical protein